MGLTSAGGVQHAARRMLSRTARKVRCPVCIQAVDSMVTCNWTERTMAYLSGRLGVYRLDAGNEFFLEPTPGFYGFIAQGTTDALNEAMRTLASHIGAPTSPIIESWAGSDSPLVAAEHDWTSDREPPGMITHDGPNFSRIRLAITNKHSPLVLGGILAHELTHHFLACRGVAQTPIEANERLTDVATAYLGLGKLTLNGYEPLTWRARRHGRDVRYTYRVGYLTSEDMALVLRRCCVFRGLSPLVAERNLSDRARELFGRAAHFSTKYERKKALVGERVCPHCGGVCTFAFGETDDGVYCARCGWEWEASLKEQYYKRRAGERRWWKPWTWWRS